MNVIVSGAAGILGEAVCAAFLDGSARVAGIARTQDIGTMMLGTPENFRWFICDDLADEEVAERAVTQSHQWLGGVDALVHVAGAFDWKRVEDSVIADWRALYATNVETTLAMVKACLGRMGDGGAIVTVGAASAQPAGEGMAAYAASKSAVARLTEALAREVRPHGIRVNAVLPSIIDTPRNRADMPDVDPAEWTSPQAVADVIRFLASPSARAISGALIPVTNNR